MTKQMAESLAAILEGEATPSMPSSRTWGVRVPRPDGRIAVIEDHAGWIYRDRSAFDAFQRDGDQEGIVRACEWSGWGITEPWATGLASLIGGEAYQSGGNIWVVLFKRADGRFVVIGEDGAELYQSADHYERYYEQSQPEPEAVHWGD